MARRTSTFPFPGPVTPARPSQRQTGTIIHDKFFYGSSMAPLRGEDRVRYGLFERDTDGYLRTLKQGDLATGNIVHGLRLERIYPGHEEYSVIAWYAHVPRNNRTFKLTPENIECFVKDTWKLLPTLSHRHSFSM